MRRTVLIVFMLVLLAACAGKENPPPAPDVRGLTGKHTEEVELLFAKAHILWKGDRCTEPQDAARMLDEVLAKEPNFAEALAYRGLAYSELGKRDEAFEDLTKAILLEPKAAYYASRGLVSLRAGVLSAARRDLDYSLKKEQKQYRAWNILGDVALQEGNAAQGCDYYAKGCSNGDCVPLQRARTVGQCK